MLVVLALVMALLATDPPQSPPGSVVEEAVKFVKQGNVEKGAELLEAHLGREPKDISARFTLGKILDFDGRPDEAAALWQAGVEGKPADVPLLVAIGELRHRQANQGSGITQRRGMITARPRTKGDDEAAFKRKRLEEAATAYARAQKMSPGDRKITTALAKVYADQEKPEAALALWKTLVEVEPDDADLRVSLARAATAAGRTDEALEQLSRAVRLNPRLAPAHKELAEVQAARGLKAEAEQSRQRAEFYGSIPAFSTLDCTEANRERLAGLNRQETVEALVADPSDAATELLAVLCWSHPHNSLEAEAFRSLEARGGKTTPILRALLDDAHSTCTIKSTAHILARRRVDGMLDRLTKLLPQDLRMMGMDMDVAGSLDDLGDPRAVGPLVEFLNPNDVDAGTADAMLSDRKSAQGRAALALGAFATPESVAALKAVLPVSRLRPYAAAARYRQTRDPAQLAELEAAVGRDDLYASYVVGDYLVRKVGTPEAKALAARWQAWRDEAKAAK